MTWRRAALATLDVYDEVAQRARVARGGPRYQAEFAQEGSDALSKCPWRASLELAICR